MAVIPSGTTPDLVSLSRDPRTGVFILSLEATSVNPENRWTLPFCRAIHKAFDAVEEAVKAKPKAPAALLTISKSPKFFSNGIDPAWLASPDTPKEDKIEWNDITMPAFARPILLGIPTVCAIGGHAFGAGMMFALSHDHRVQRVDRGFMCAIEVAIGVPTPAAEMTLFKHSVPDNAFYETVLEAKRWSGKEAFERGIVQQACSQADLIPTAQGHAAKLAKIVPAGAMGYTKWVTKGYVAQEILEHIFPGGKVRGRGISPGLATHVHDMVTEKRQPWSAKVLSRIKL